MLHRVLVISLGPAQERVGLRGLVKLLNEVQDQYEFAVGDDLLNLPPPSRPREDGRNDPPQYAAKDLFEYMKKHREAGETVLVGVIDSEVYNELFSATDADNSAIVVSMRVDGLPRLLKLTRKTWEQYVALEIGAQLLAIQYRRNAALSADPEECEAPWHVDRRNCLFDYYGLSEDDVGLSEDKVSKLLSPKLSDQTLTEMREAEVPRSLIDATLNIVRGASRTRWRTVARRVLRDPVVTIALGAGLGLIASVLAQGDARIWAPCLAVAFLIVIGRILLLKYR